MAALALIVSASPTAAQAATWRQVSNAQGSNIDQVNAVRTADGVLHVAWKQRSGPNTDDLFHTRIEPNGRVGATVPIVQGWASILDPAIVNAPGGLRVFWGGIRSTDTTDPSIGVLTSISADGGATWATQEGSITPNTAQAYGSDMAAATLANGTVLQAWAGTLGTWIHAGLDPLTPNVNFQEPLGSYGNYPGIAADASGGATMAWFSSAAGHVGVLAQAVGADGNPAGPVQRMPGTQVMVGNGTVATTPIAARIGGGYYVIYGVGYPSAGQIRLWKVGSSTTTLLGRASGSPYTTVAAGPDGRLWAAWSDGVFGSKRMIATRSNKSATRFGAWVDAGAVRGGHSVYAVDGAATPDGELDLLALFGTGTGTDSGTYVTRVLPGLTLTASRRSLGRIPRRVTFTVSDAGDRVRGATVSVSGRSATTNRRGRVTFTLADRATARASLDGYTAGSVRLR